MEEKSKEIIKRLGHRTLYVNALNTGHFKVEGLSDIDSIYTYDFYELIKIISLKNGTI